MQRSLFSRGGAAGSGSLLPVLIVFNTVLLSFLSFVVLSSPSPKSAPIPAPATAELVALRQQINGLLKMRVAYGELYCKLNGIGPTGGFCVKDKSDVGGNTAWDEPVCSMFAKVFAKKSVLDLGCGLGHYGRCLQAAGTGVQWTGLDGSEGIENATGGSLGEVETPTGAASVYACRDLSYVNKLAFSRWRRSLRDVLSAGGYVKFVDLTVPQYLGQQYDWVMSLEVGEHIPKEHEHVLLETITRHAKEGVVLTWAVPGQGGHHHVNEQPNADIISKLRRLGFTYDTAASNNLRQAAVLHWFKNTIMVFRRDT